MFLFKMKLFLKCLRHLKLFSTSLVIFEKLLVTLVHDVSNLLKILVIFQVFKFLKIL